LKYISNAIQATEIHTISASVLVNRLHGAEVVLTFLAASQ
jgi:hypothetical protein